MDNPDQQINKDESNISQALSVLDGSTKSKERLRAVEALGNPSQVTPENRQQIAERLIQTVLTDSDDEVRAEAINSLYFLSDEYIDTLVSKITDNSQYDTVTEVSSEWLTSTHSEFRMVGATAMASFGEEISPELETALTDDDPRVQARAVRAYGAIGTDSVEPIRPLLQTRNSHVRHAAVSALTNIGTPAAFNMLSSLVRANDEQLRTIAVKYLYQLDRQNSARMLLSTLGDRSETVRRTAMVSLIRLFAEGEAVAPSDVRDYIVGQSFDHEQLGETLHMILFDDGDEHATTETDRYTVWLLGELIGSVEDQVVVPWLISALQHRDTMAADIAAAYVPLLEAPTVEKELQMLISNSDIDSAVSNRAERILDRLRHSNAEAVEQRSIEYTYVRHPADYTQKYRS